MALAPTPQPYRFTVEEYLAKACDKLGVRRRVQAVVRARRLGLLEEEP